MTICNICHCVGNSERPALRHERLVTTTDTTSGSFLEINCVKRHTEEDINYRRNCTVEITQGIGSHASPSLGDSVSVQAAQ